MKYTEEQYYKDIKNHLLGTSVVEVYYEVLNSYDELDPYEDWELSKDIHSVDMNVIFKLDNGKLIQIFWDSNFYCYGVGLEVLPVFEERESIKLINVSEKENVLKLLGSKIVDVLVYWDESEIFEIETINNNVVKNHKEDIRVSLTWQIKFENCSNIWIATLDISHAREPYYWADHLTIFFNEEDVRKYNLNSDNGISINSVIE